MKTVVLSLALGMAGAAAPLVAQTAVVYDTVAARHQAQLSRNPCTIPADLKTKDSYQVVSVLHNWSATVLETDAVSVPYSDARACILLKGTGDTTWSIALADFRTLRVQWINERLLYLFTDVGHVAGVGQLLDVEDMKWLYRRTEYYRTGSDTPSRLQNRPRQAADDCRLGVTAWRPLATTEQVSSPNPLPARPFIDAESLNAPPDPCHI